MEAPSSSSDTRNKDWRNQNKGLALLQSMGWSEGQAVGKRQRTKEGAADVSSEGLRVLKRPDQLGLGAAPAAAIALASSNQVRHVEDFSNLLQSLAPSTTHMNTNETKKKKKKSRDKSTLKKSKLPHLPTNKRTHTKVRQAKFQTKSAEDYKCIFATSSGQS